MVEAGPAGERKALLAQVHIAVKALAMEDDDYRALLKRVAGVASAKDCDIAGLRDVAGEMARLGFRRDIPQARRAQHPVAKKARALWISLHQLGAIADPSERALEAFGRRQLGVDKLQWMDQAQGFRLIEALKSIGVRHGWAQDLPKRTPASEQVRLLKAALVAAIKVRLADAGVALGGPLAADHAEWDRTRLDAAARELGVILRAALRRG